MELKLNLGLTDSSNSLLTEKHKYLYAVKRGVEWISDVSVTRFDEIKTIFNFKKHNILSVPLYEAFETEKSVFEIIEQNNKLGYSGYTIHLTPNHLIEKAIHNKIMVNSRGGYYLMKYGENPYLENIEKLFELLKGKKIFIGTIFRPGKIKHDNELYIEELKYVHELQKKLIIDYRIHVEIEFGGHMVIDNNFLSSYNFLNRYNNYSDSKGLCVMGPLQSDACNGLDNVNAILGTYKLSENFEISTACIITPAEHLRFPTLQDTKDGIDSYCVLRQNMITEKTKKIENLASNKFACCSKYSVIDKNLQTVKVNSCGMCGDKCPIYLTKYIKESSTLCRIVENHDGDVVFIGAPYSGKSSTIEMIDTQNKHVVSIGDYCREYNINEQIPNHVLFNILENTRSRGNRIIDNLIKYESQVILFPDLIKLLNNPIFIVIKRDIVDIHVRQGRKETINSIAGKIKNWQMLEPFIENKLNDLNLVTYIYQIWN